MNLRSVRARKLQDTLLTLTILLTRIGICALLLYVGVTLAATDPIELPDGSLYTGERRGHLLHGSGNLQWGDGRSYTGDFRDGRIHGHGILHYPDGDRYEGQFKNGLRHGRGRFTSADDERYEGEFKDDVFSGSGTHSDGDTLVYEGSFRAWRYHGLGRFIWSNGDEYIGGFADGLFHGLGEVHYKNPHGGKQQLAGEWDHGKFLDAAENHAEKRIFDVEHLLFQQQRLLDKALENVATSIPGFSDLFFLGFAGDGNQDVFMKEVSYAETLMKKKFGAANFSLTLINNPATVSSVPLATTTNLEYALSALATRMQEEDILFLLLTSHGSEDHHLMVDLANLPLANLSSSRLAELLQESGIKWKVVVISACYSGGFIAPLENDTTLIITAASAEKLSFGCADDAELTYFGRAFFAHGLAHSSSLLDAFQQAKHKVRAMEKAANYDHSEPQIRYTPAILDKLSNWQH